MRRLAQLTVSSAIEALSGARRRQRYSRAHCRLKGSRCLQVHSRPTCSSASASWSQHAGATQRWSRSMSSAALRAFLLSLPRRVAFTAPSSATLVRALRTSLPAPCTHRAAPLDRSKLCRTGRSKSPAGNILCRVRHAGTLNALSARQPGSHAVRPPAGVPRGGPAERRKPARFGRRRRGGVCLLGRHG